MTNLSPPHQWTTPSSCGRSPSPSPRTSPRLRPPYTDTTRRLTPSNGTQWVSSPWPQDPSTQPWRSGTSRREKLPSQSNQLLKPPLTSTGTTMDQFWDHHGTTRNLDSPTQEPQNSATRLMPTPVPSPKDSPSWEPLDTSWLADSARNTRESSTNGVWPSPMPPSRRSRSMQDRMNFQKHIF